MARKARRQLEGRHLLFGEYLRGPEQPQTCSIEDELNIDGGNHVLTMHVFKLGIILNDNKTITELSYHVKNY